MADSSSTAPTEAPLASLPPDHPAQAYGGLSAPELLQFVQLAGPNRTHPETQVIFTAFYHRYFRYLMTVVANSLGFIHDRDGLREIVDDTLAAFFRASDRFDMKRATDASGCDQLIRSYLGCLARWKASDARSFQKSFGSDTVDATALEMHVNEASRVGVPDTAKTELAVTNPRNLAAVTTWMAALREIERDVLQTYFLDDQPGWKSSRLPDGVAEQLAARHQTTPSNLRHLKRKLLQQMREQFQNL